MSRSDIMYKKLLQYKAFKITFDLHSLHVDTEEDRETVMTYNHISGPNAMKIAVSHTDNKDVDLEHKADAC